MRSCDTMVALGSATASGQVLFAKNSDRPTDECQPLVRHDRHFHPPSAAAHCRFLQVPRGKETYAHIGSRPWWCWGYEHGFNQHQVVIGNEGLFSKIESAEPKLIGMEVLRLGLERSRTAAEAVDVMTGIIGEYGQGRFDGGEIRTYDNGYLVADPREAYVIETAGHHWAVKRAGATAGISNVYSIGGDWDRLSPDAERVAREQGWWSPDAGRLSLAEAFGQPGFGSRDGESGARRRARSRGVLARESRRIDAASMMALLRDHGDGVDSAEPFRAEVVDGGICMHAREGSGRGSNTAASLVAHLFADGSRLPIYWCSFYSPCIGVFFPVFIEGELPRILAAGGAEPSDESPWWLFHRLSGAVRRNPERTVPLVRRRWAEFQERLLDSADRIAVEERRRIDSGDVEGAGRRLTEYMKSNVAEMLSIVRDLLGEIECGSE